MSFFSFLSKLGGLLLWFIENNYTVLCNSNSLLILQPVNWWAKMCKKSNSGTCWPQFKLKFKVLWIAIVLKYIGSIIQRPCRSPTNQVFTLVKSVKEKLVQQLCFSTKKTKCTIVEKYTGYKNIFHKREFGFRIL